MSLSLNKLCKLINDKNLVPKKYYRYENNCIFIEIISLTNSVNFLLYIPSRFEIPMSTNSPNIIDINMIDTENMDFNKKDTNLLLKNSNRILQNTIKQTERLEKHINNSNYTISINDAFFLVFIRKGDCDCYKMLNNNKATKSLLVTLSLPDFYQKNKLISNEIADIYSGFEKILQKNISDNYSDIEDIINNRYNILQNYQNKIESIKRNKKLIDEYNNSLKRITNIEIFLKNDWDKNSGKITQCADIKKKIISNITQLSTTNNNLLIRFENYYYVNNIILSNLIENMEDN